MAKRFTDTELWGEDWFIDLSTEEKLFWIYLKDACNHAGVWRINKRQFEFSTGLKINLEKFFKDINSDKERVVKIGRDRWYILGFVKFQYGEIRESNSNLHKSILKNLTDCGIDISEFTRNLPVNDTQREGKPTLKDKDKDKVKEKERKGGLGEKQNPTIEQVKLYFIESGYSEQAGERAWKYYDVAGWIDSKGNEVLNWKQKMQAVWFKDENRAVGQSQSNSGLDAKKSAAKIDNRGY